MATTESEGVLKIYRRNFDIMSKYNVGLKTLLLQGLSEPEFYGDLVIVRLAGDHLYGKYLFTWLSLVMSLMASYCAVLFPTRCLG